MAESQAIIPETHDVATPSFLHRTLRGAWRAIAGVARGKSPDIAPDLPPGNIPRLRKQIRECVEVRGGEVSTRARAPALGATYLSHTKDGRRRFLEVLADKTELDAATFERTGVGSAVLVKELQGFMDRHDDEGLLRRLFRAVLAGYRQDRDLHRMLMYAWLEQDEVENKRLWSQM